MRNGSRLCLLAEKSYLNPSFAAVDHPSENMRILELARLYVVRQMCEAHAGYRLCGVREIERCSAAWASAIHLCRMGFVYRRYLHKRDTASPERSKVLSG